MAFLPDLDEAVERGAEAPPVLAPVVDPERIGDDLEAAAVMPLEETRREVRGCRPGDSSDPRPARRNARSAPAMPSASHSRILASLGAAARRPCSDVMSLLSTRAGAAASVAGARHGGLGG